MFDIDVYNKKMADFRRDLTYRRVMRLTNDVDWWGERERESRAWYDSERRERVREIHRKSLREAKQLRKKYRYELACESEKLARMVFGPDYLSE